MLTNKVSKIIISLSESELSVLQNALTLLRDIHKEIDNNHDADEYDFDSNRERNLLVEMYDELEEICIF